MGQFRTRRDLEGANNHQWKHGLRRSPEYAVWNAMIQRCSKPNCKAYPNYGGRGIKVCDAWREFTRFYMDMGPRPTSGHTIERKDNDGNYEPTNCHWVTRAEQSRNNRKSIRIAYQGRTLCLKDWADEKGLNPVTLQKRVRAGWSAEKALTTPPRGRKGKERWRGDSTSV